MIKAVIFDMNGTMIYDVRLHNEAFRIFYQRHHKKFDESEMIKNVAGKNNRAIMKYVFGADISDQEIQAFAEEKEQIYRDFVFDSLPLRKYFQVIIGDESINHGKPDPEIYLLTAKELHEKPENCLVFEDTSSGVLAAKRAEMKVAALLTSRTKEELKGADEWINNFHERVSFLLL